MRIVIDLQGAQTTGSRFRGIGRYSLALAQAMAAAPRGHEVWIALNGLFADSIAPLRAAFDGLVPPERVAVWQAPARVAEGDPANRWRREAGERLREAFLARLEPDVIHVSSLFEGFGDDALTSIGVLDSVTPTAVTLYDLIPLVQRKVYLANAAIESWYEQKLDMLRRASVWLAISESSRQEGIEVLGLPSDGVVNVSTAADAMFRPVDLDRDAVAAIRRRYGLDREFLMYTGGIDHRKNIEGLVRGYARLPAAVRAGHQLAVVCSANDAQRAMLERAGATAGLAPGELVLTGFIPDEDMVALYNLCRAFAFPSWHEGFGLPALEAMSCGAAVVAANTSSLPEVVGRDDALFDPHDDASIAASLHSVLTDDVFRNRLREHGPVQARRFSWASSATRVLDAFETLDRRRADGVHRIAHSGRPRLAYLSPLPPQPSGIADISAELLPELARHYEIELVVPEPAAIAERWRKGYPVRTPQWFEGNAHRYDRVLYHFGNSSFHQHMFALVERHPGTVVLHDFFLSGALFHAEVTGYAPGIAMQALYRSHGYAALADRFRAPTHDEVALSYPANLPVLQQAQGIIVHSEYSRTLATKWYGTGAAGDWAMIPLLHRLHVLPDRAAARAELGIEDGAFLVCSFGLVAPTKRSRDVLAAWLASPLGRNPRCRLVFVGENHAGDYGAGLAADIAASGAADRISITGFAPEALYRRYLAAADAAVQLRALSRGETSRAVLDCMGYGIPAIVNAHGALAELRRDCLLMQDDECTVAELAAALARLHGDQSLRRALGERGRRHVRETHDPRAIADRYRDAIELHASSGAATWRSRAVGAVAAIEPGPGKRADWETAAVAIAANHPPAPRLRQLLVEVGDADAPAPPWQAWLAGALAAPRRDCRVEPVRAGPDGTLRYARVETLERIGCPSQWLADEPVDAFSGDVFFADLRAAARAKRVPTLRALRAHGVAVHLWLEAGVLPSAAGDRREGPDQPADVTRSVVESCDAVICASPVAAGELAHWLGVPGPAGLPRIVDGSAVVRGEGNDGATAWIAVALGAAVTCPTPGNARDSSSPVLRSAHVRTAGRDGRQR